MTRLAFIGAGLWMRTYHLPTARRLAEEGEVSLAAIWNRTTEKAKALAEEFGISRVHQDLDSLIVDPEIDVFVVALTKESVGPVLRKLAPRGLPILVEKPPASGSAEARELARLLKQPVMVAFNRNYTPLYDRLRSLLGETEVRFAECHFLRRRRDDPKYVTETGIHALAFLDSLLGPGTLSDVRTRAPGAAGPDSGSDSGSDSGPRSAPPPGFPAWHARLDHDGGCRTELHFLPFAGHAVERYQFHGRDRSIYITMKQHYARDEESALEIWSVGDDGEAQRELVPFPREDVLLHDGYRGEYRRFLEALQGKGELPTTLEWTVRIMELAEWIEQG